MQRTSDINVLTTHELPSPVQLFEELPKSPAQAEFITRSREDIHRVIFTEDKRFLLIIGPCSIHDLDAGREYARRLAALAAEVSEVQNFAEKLSGRAQSGGCLLYTSDAADE